MTAHTPAIDFTHDPELRSWVASAGVRSDFPLQNLPFGVVAGTTGVAQHDAPRGVVRIGDAVLDLRGLAASGLLIGDAQSAAEAAAHGALNDLFALGSGPRVALRRALHYLLVEGAPRQDTVARFLTPLSEVDVLLPARIGDYTDFYVGIHHARNIGALFRPSDPLLPNYKWVPIGYHGRASSVRVSGTPITRPNGQLKAADAPAPVFEPTRRMDFELELGVWIGPGNRLGEPVSLDHAESHVAGYCLLNDWSARDVQAWEYQPLGPFLSKSFGTTVSPWVITPEALAPFRIPVDRAEGDPEPLPYLDSPQHRGHGGLQVELHALIRTAQMRKDGDTPHLISRSSSRHMYWSVAQMITHHTSNGCELRPGDLLGSGTISGPSAGSEGSLMELSHGGSAPITLPNGETRTFLEDGDEVILTARAHRAGAAAIGFGECVAVVRPAIAYPTT
ncbi:fumarylacetoacetase [Mycobacterium sp. CBMA293]|uniref:fumarylacetoacetase n=1 Tax=unclassified Mycolicibacterium TaxID=2636767 RepID=UPI0012DEAD5C|nr:MULTISPECIES: fumarylacetoacetase [unclassified Mycolicibacterium]MUL49013.1 fumarylacetoacetase [Mycolicibacterium sp. CBMA 360]MUL58572.1 fumarylacetoacetase [Mycolicibacterium sp. CBMA 335]MUL74030.1 fumarylacetoacetase [Mycolicibacterium sp. CBMA 311]MUL93455.1 fumarylacetoacetase [Mycolicibacterium sp. CBMA 230]MUM04673.1 fumarylacetoacetase [Mycolicibacterium sp. CBMA 213]